MVDWESPKVIGMCLEATDKLNMYFGGIFTWYLIATFKHVEWQLLTRRLKWRWSYLYYLGARYMLLGFQIPLHEVVQPGKFSFEILAITGCAISICASGNLLFRVIALWRGNLIVVAFLVFLGIGHWVVLFSATTPPVILGHGNFPNGSTKTNNNAIEPFFLYTCALDLLILVMTAVGLLRQRAARSSRLWKTLYRQGIAYYVVMFIVQFPTIIFAWRTKSSCMIGVFSAPTLTIGAMASSYAVSSLLTRPRTAEPARDDPAREKRGLDVSRRVPTRSQLLSTNITLPLSVESSEAPSSAIASLPEVHMRGGARDLECAAGPTGGSDW
ncbi:uncharacterized protein PHACADRAFT_198550 [Phanerochaete carnosa HHB-10118-sp]|uniref:G-protein coupled receptors family 3 profile domain-containing protein n=1 Tax=Phanerochaete carnosa (strain HHB-10118-sp) TaxID=650164 RepID=K5URH4_PHACS|nr:uncharacterized protein PHACADRAFT_198550 [Phanerochaete carnosa HHB-10118-sp]EKM52491.1 hypothetical protein PHACADRAFT_198550 [Phanerochaete carnosa HHB-10118-sp]